MRTISKITLATVGVACALVATTNVAATADPPKGVHPAKNSIVGVGSDTSQYVVQALTTNYDAQSPAPANPAYNYLATGTASIQTKTSCSFITRPNGSGAGISALKANARPSGDKTDYCIDFARSSRGPQAGDGTNLAFVAYAQDAVTWSSTSSAAHPTHAPSALSITQLDAIYSCNAALLKTGKKGAVTWNEVGGTGTDAVVPVVPQSSSGTRSFFLNAIGNPTLGSCVQGQDNSVEENEGTNAIFSGANSADLVFPYSVAVYLSQSEHNHNAGTQGNQVLGSVINRSGTAIAPTTGTAPNAQLNPGLAAVGLTRFIYNVVRDNGTSTHVPTYLQPLFGADSDTGYICTNAKATSAIRSYGFRTIGTTCGSVTQPTS